jgi:hypothetical protein
VTPRQVQAAWIELPARNPQEIFPADQVTYQGKHENVLRIAKVRYPNLRIAHLSSRTYGGYSDKTSSNVDIESPAGKLYAYQSAFGVKWAIEKQIDRDPSLDPDPDGDPATNDGIAPWIAWGPSASEWVVDVVASRNSAYTLTVGSGQTQRYQQATSNGTTNKNVRGAAPTEPGAASVTMSWTLSTSTEWALIAVPLKPAF